MIAIPAIDLREGSCVQLIGGSYASERIRLPDPVGIAREFVRLGFSRLHLVDLDAATGRGSNEDLVRTILGLPAVHVQVGGGLRDEARVAEVLEQGAGMAVVGTRAMHDLDWLSDMAEKYPGEIVLAMDVRHGRLATHGWIHDMPGDPIDLADEVSRLPLGGILVTAVDREGRLCGPDLHLVEDVVESAGVPVLASGGIASLHHLRDLEDRGAAAAVVGTALYTGALAPALVAREYGA